MMTSRMSYAAKGFVEGVRDAGEFQSTPPIGDRKWLPAASAPLILILTAGKRPKYYGETKAIDR